MNSRKGDCPETDEELYRTLDKRNKKPMKIKPSKMSLEEFLGTLVLERAKYNEDFKLSEVGFWIDQYELYQRGFRDEDMHDSTLVILSRME